MLRIILRFLGLMLLAGGFAALVVDGTRSIASNTLVLTSLGETLMDMAPTKYPLWQAAIEKKFGAWAWDPVTSTLFALPNWLIAGAIGGLLFLITRRRRATIGYSSR